MKILLPFKRENNPYLEELTGHSSHSFVYDDYQNFNTSFDFVNIHWPEAIYKWLEPSKNELEELEAAILEWKKSSVLVYTKHDFQRNKGTTPNFTRLFNLVERHTDVFVHLGKFSKSKYEKQYPHAKHELVYHPLFKRNVEITPKSKAREILGIDQDSKVIIIPGKIRSFEERDMVLNSFKALKMKNKVLISPNMRTELRYDFRGRVRLKKIFDVQEFFKTKFKEKHQPPVYLFEYKPMSTKDLSLRMSAADVVLVPRKDLLNSGIVFLGLSFRRPVVGPAVGNIEEQLKELGFPVFEPDSISSVTEAIEEGFKLNETMSDYPDSIKKYHPENVGRGYDQVLRKYKKYD